MNNVLKKIPLLLVSVTLFFLGVLSACSSLVAENSYEYPISESIEEYSINSSKILTFLAQGQTNVFTPHIETPEAEPLNPDGSILWNQADYYLIGRTFHEFIMQESIENWVLHRMRFNVKCENASQGFYLGGFQFYKTETRDEQEIRIVHEIAIAPLYDSITSFERKLSPVREQWEPINLDQIKISATDAINIAEKQGGQEVRSSILNACEINLSLAPGSVYDGWQISYIGDDNEQIFQIYVDPFTGEYDIVHP
jgi:hypothetical protein